MVEWRKINEYLRSSKMIKIYNILGNCGTKAEKGLVLEEKKLLQKIQLYLKLIQE